MHLASSRGNALWIVLLVVGIAAGVGLGYFGPKLMAEREAAERQTLAENQPVVTERDIQEHIQTVTLSGVVTPETFESIKGALLSSFCQMNREVWDNQYIAARFVYTDADGTPHGQIIPASECPPPEENKTPIIPDANSPAPVITEQ